jgi:nitrate/TMAO reductase-like tetraheme cytochrome c subunit
VKRRATALFLAISGSAVFAAAQEIIPPRPHGWIGTVEEWARGLGIVFGVLDLLLIFAMARSIRRSGLTASSRSLMFLSVGVVPLALVFFAYAYAISASQKVEACGACHVMGPWVNDLHDPKSATLADVHFKNRYIQENHCYTCHSDYGMSGGIGAKVAGLGHIYHYSTGTYEVPIKIAHPYPNQRCLNCHAGSQKFIDPAKHPKEDMADLMSGKTSCIDCHGPAHPPQPQEKIEKRAAR